MILYTFSKLCAPDRLTLEIQTSAIVTALDHIETASSPATTRVYFKDTLSTSDEAALGTLVDAHVNTPLPSGAQPVVLSSPVAVSSTPAFASKTFGTKSLFKRVVGQQISLSAGSNTFTYTETFPWVKFMALEIVNGEAGDYCSLYILDTAAGTFSGVANAQLNQFGFTTNIAAGFYQHRSEFDADVYQGLQIKIVYQSLSAKTIGVNYVMNEVK
jgi:hypothetical protein